MVVKGTSGPGLLVMIGGLLLILTGCYFLNGLLEGVDFFADQ